MHHAQLLRTRIVHVEHILQPVRSLGHSHINPVGIIVLHAAVPDFLEAEDVFVKSVGGSPVFHHNPDMNDALRDAALGQELPEITAVKRARSELDELYEVSVRIRDLETSITILHGLKLLGHLHALPGQLRWAGAWELTRVSPPAQQGHGEGESKAGILPRIGVEGSRITFYAASEIASSLSFSSAKTAFRVRATSM